MQKKQYVPILVGLLAVVLLAGAFSAGVFVGYLLPRGADGSTPLTDLIAPALPQGSSSLSAQELQTLFKPFWESWDLVHQKYVDQPVDNTKLMRGAIQGMIGSLGDAHSSFMDPATFTSATEQLTGSEYEGIGAFVDITGEFLKIISPMPDSPAMKAGLKPGDLVIAVDKQDMTGTAGDLVLKKILGPAGTTVVLTIHRGEADPFDVSITRARITTPQVDWRMESNNIAYIRLYTYGSLTTAQLKRALQELLPQNPKGLILDLRNNGGGYRDTAFEVLSQFLPADQVVMFEDYGNGKRTTYKSSAGGLALEIPMIVLVNEGSASASEITAGALQDYARAKLLGVKTYGKGSVQDWVALQDNQGAIRITIARWLTPKERQINKLGLEPDLPVTLSDEDLKTGHDSQLLKAIDLLSAK